MNRVYIAFGSNVGDSKSIIEKAFILIEQNNMKIINKSALYETKPYGYKDQPNFINGALEIETEFNARQTLERLLAIEKELGRTREIHWGPRTLDLDVIFFNNEIYKEEDLVIPHPDMQNRDFVLKPLNDICPEYVHPETGKSVEQMLGELRIEN